MQRWRGGGERQRLPQVVQPAFIGLIDGTISTLAPIFATAHIAGSRAALLVGLAASPALAYAVWWRRHPPPCPYGQRVWVELRHPSIARDRMPAVLEPRPGERVLEVGPGTFTCAALGEVPEPGAALAELRVLERTDRGALGYFARFAPV